MAKEEGVKPWYKTWRVGVLIFFVIVVVALVVSGALTNWWGTKTPANNDADPSGIGLMKTNNKDIILPDKSVRKRCYFYPR
jgi:hypothetical protein